MTRVIVYSRVSTEEQADRGVSLAAQEERCRAYAGLYQLEVVQAVADRGLSGKSLDRPALQDALAMIEDGAADGLLVAKLDRLTRSVRDLGELLDGLFKSAALFSVSEQIDTRSAGGRLVLNVLASVSQWEREAIGERTATALRHKRSRGERVGSVPLGYALSPDGRRVVETESGSRMRAAIREYRALGLSLRSIRDQVAAEYDVRPGLGTIQRICEEVVQ